MKSYKTLRRRLLEDKEVKKAYENLDPEFALIRSLIQKRIERGFTQEELARRIGTKQSAISRLESGEYNPTIGILRKVAKALSADLNISIR